jgi:hypothetical protein
MQGAEVIIASFPTTCLVEAYAMGKKILYINFCGTDKYHCDLRQNIVYSGDVNDVNLLFNKLDELQTMTDAKFSKKNADLMEYYVLSPKKYSTQHMIMKNISTILELQQD